VGALLHIEEENEMKLDGQVAIVTGGGQGIGRAIAFALAEQGASVVIADINIEVANTASDEIKGAGYKAVAIKADISKSEEVNQLVNKTLDMFHRIDILVNNAGLSEPTPVIELTEKRWDRVIDINLKGPFICSQAVGKYMIEQKHGKIINIASVVSQLAHPTQAAYCASKAGLVLLTKVMAAEWGKYNINVNAISPGAVETPRMQKFREENPSFLEGRVEATPIGRFIKPEEIANAVLFLASSYSDAITGANIVVDGGSSSVWAGAVPELHRR
jgi:NAD(P)-dependent dehydrogenase (short-subunit alcohol dehydrogenase family)